MADATFTLFRGAAATSNTTLYTSPADMAVAVTNIAITNSTTSATTATINLMSGSSVVPLLSSVSIAANTTQFVDLDQIVYNAERVEGSASTTAVYFHIAGYEVY